MSKGLSLLTGSVAALALTLSIGVAQTSVSTEPQGYVTLDIAANDYTFLGFPMYREAVFQGAADSVATSTVTFEGTPFSAGDYDAVLIGATPVNQYFIEVMDGSDPGALIPVVSNTVSSITLSEDVSAFISNGTVLKLRPYHTLDSLFPSGGNLTGGFSAAFADEILVFDAASQTTSRYFYSLLGSEWRQGATANGSRPILPNQGVFINRKSGATTVTVEGIVKTGTTALDILPGYNLIPNPYPFPFTFDLSELYTGDNSTGVAAGFSAAFADEVIVFGPSGSSTTYFYSLLGSEWRTGATPAGSIEIPVGGTLFINRKAAEGAFSWVKTQPFSLTD